MAVSCGDLEWTLSALAKPRVVLAVVDLDQEQLAARLRGLGGRLCSFFIVDSYSLARSSSI